MSRRNIKREPVERAAVSPVPTTATNKMRPPSPVSTRKRATPLEEVADARSGAFSFTRSHAPSAETAWHRREEEQEPMLLEMRHRPDGLNNGHESPASSQTHDNSFAQQSFAHPTFTDIGMKLKACNDTLGDLQQLGVSHVAALPELVLVGDQSAGKSSLMSGLAMVNLPRSAGVGTRCPLHIRLIGSNNAHWSCTVSLQQDYDFKPTPGMRIKKSDVTNANPFPPWVKKSHRDTKIFKTIFDQTEIEEVLRWAQIAILNHNRSHELFIPGEGSIAKEKELAVAASETDAQFSPNIVALEIKGPGLPDLSFYDLPGVFLSPDQEEDEYVVKVVRNLTRDYIRREKAIIMWALPMNADPENSISLGIIREAKASDRTIGIMTKADKLADDNKSQWLAMFRGEKQSVGHGFFATSRPPEEALEAATKWEELFFSHEVGGWPADFADYAERCGVKLLREYISVQLGNAFSRSLPSIKKKVYHRLRTIEQQLVDLPELPANVEHEVKKSLYQFLNRMKTAIKDSQFSSPWNTLNDQFESCIFKIKPTCQVKDPETQTIDLSDADTEASAATPSKRPRPSDSTVRTPNKRQRQGNEATPVKHESFVGVSGINGTPRASFTANTPTSGPPSPFVRYFHLGRLAMDIKDIRSEVMRKKRPGMPRDLVPDEVRETMCMNAVKKWEAPLEAYISKTAELLERVASQVLEESLGVLRRRLIFKECKAHLKEFLDEAVAYERARLSELFDSETYQIYMKNEDAFTRYKAQELGELRRARALNRLKDVALIKWEYNIKRTEDMSEEEKNAERKLLDQHLPKLGKDPWDTEIEVAGFVRGYYMTAATRFVERVTMDVNSRLFRTIGESGFDMFMDQRLGVFGAADINVYNHLMEEDEQTAKTREQLKREMDKLERAMTSINDLESSSNSASFNAQPRAHAVEMEDVTDEGEL
ncbi:Uu.00g132440.m01.CDS01 [Anthostomella pinea]|uniref:Uu.00g132440.m01.CDS01 n=1 Tax=Anthostomella pinea TaxID=933095 RepID=A0AAI8YI93_9PEZI|nr:Uu.00g132440.m01.CDS01 [Anthostomella pinea]